MVWVKPSVQGSSPSGRGGCASAVVGDMCLFIGGADRSPRGFNDVWILKLGAGGADDGASGGANSSRWVKKTTTVKGGGRLPDRTGATATAVGRKVYVFGGQEPTRGVCFNDVVVLDCDKWEWSRLEITGASPPPRNSHAAVAANGGRLLVVYGGASPDDGPMGDVYVLDLQEGAERWIRPRVGGQSPEPREMHTACMIPATSSTHGGGGGGGGGLGGDWSGGDHEMMVIGGRGKGGVLSDIAVLDVKEMAWVRRGDTRRAICAHTAVPWVITTTTATTAHHRRDGGGGGGGGGSGEEEEEEGVVGDEEDEKVLRAGAVLVFGGFDGRNLHESVPLMIEGSTLTVIDAAAPDVDAATAAPEPRFAHAAVALPKGAAMLVFGGVTFAADLNDLAVWVDVNNNNNNNNNNVPAPPPPPVAVPASDLD